MKDYEELPPIPIERGRGVCLYDVYGKEYIDMNSSRGGATCWATATRR